MATPGPNSTAEFSGKTLRILIVDDNHDAAKALARLLSVAGHKTHIAFDGATAINAASDFDPDVVLLDIGMPGKSGYDVCASIRAQPRQKALAIFAVTGWGDTSDRVKSHEAGFNEHLVKPVKFEDLERLLSECIERLT